MAESIGKQVERDSLPHHSTGLDFFYSRNSFKLYTALKIDFGPGYRVYYGRDGQRLIILPAGGSKRKQSADIEAAKKRWEAYRKARRTHGTDTRI